ncbi:MAG: crossover junction endodeoxyribonuclease RuvC, partial [Sedimenticola sp.]|nr:crossover junction endodeoxyribonuclease RuvC [Sedimenticola sp.]
MDSDGSRSSHIASGCIRIADEAFPQRLGEIFSQLTVL